MSTFLDDNHVVTGLFPKTDLYEGSPATDVISMARWGQCTFILSEGAGGTATNVITIEACSDAAATATSAIAYKYRLCGTTDTWGAATAIAATGYTTVAGANQMVAIEIDAAQLPAGYPFVRMQLTEGVDAASAAGVIAILSKPRYAESVPVTAIA
jgi:hypothetical protein